MEEQVSLKEILKENIILIILIVIIAVVSLVMAVTKNLEKKDITDYSEVKDNNKISDKIDTKKIYNENEYRVINVTNQALINAYYMRYIRMTVDNPKRSWDMLSVKGKEYFFNDIDKYLQFLDDKKTIHTYFNEVYQYKIEGGTVTLIDTEDYKYRLIIYGVWDYEVEFVKLV